MTNPVIVVEQLGKQYNLAQSNAASQSKLRFSEVLAAKLRNPWSRPAMAVDQFWALRDVSFNVEEGEVVGIIGRNGAGKSTLLKILSRITEPSCGRVRLRGRVASLLEVGTGFHPELTGRENIYLNGAILGLKRAEISRRFDAIVDFAGTERFLDTPVKRYSSGMSVRLAFAVAAHLEPEILVVDEVLAVGDVEFQKKCLGKMSEVSKGGRTVLFVSHNLQAIASLCMTTVVLDKGQIIFHAGAQEGISAYLNTADTSLDSHYIAPAPKEYPHFSSIKIHQSGQGVHALEMHKPIHFDFEIDLHDLREANCTIVITNSQGVTVCHCSEEFEQDAAAIRRSTLRRCTLPAHTLNADRYVLTVAVHSRIGNEVFEKLEGVLSFEVEFAGPGSQAVTRQGFKGMTSPGLIQWEILKPHG